MRRLSALLLALLLALSACAAPIGSAETTASSALPETTASVSVTQSSAAETTAATTAEPSGPELALRFIAFSDTHLTGKTSDVSASRLRKIFRAAYAYAETQEDTRLDAALAAGDMTNGGSDSQLSLFRQIADEELRGGTALLCAMGNHEFYSLDGADAAYSRFEAALGQEPNSDTVISGFHFITLSPDDGVSYSGSTEWLAAALASASAEDEAKPIFVVQHIPVYGTVYGSTTAGTTQLSAFEAYPQVVDFSGHTHFPINDPRSIWQGGFTTLNCGSNRYFTVDAGLFSGLLPPEAENANQFWIVEVYADNSVVFRAYDCISGGFFTGCTWSVETPSDPNTFIYTDGRAETSASPEFDGGEVTAEAGKTYADLSFAQAKGEDGVSSYVFEVYTSDGTLTMSKSFTSQFYIEGLESLTCRLRGLAEDTLYRAVIRARNTFGKLSESALTAEFKTN